MNTSPSAEDLLANRRSVWAEVSANGPLAGNRIASELGLPRGVVYRALYQLEKAGYVEHLSRADGTWRATVPLLTAPEHARLVGCDES